LAESEKILAVRLGEEGFSMNSIDLCLPKSRSGEP
jgi:hypothetical protein